MTDKKPAEGESQPSNSASTIPGDPEQSVYRFIIVAAKRARQLQTGQRPKVAAAGRKVTRVAVEEVRKGLIEYVDLGQTPPPAPEEEESADQ